MVIKYVSILSFSLHYSLEHCFFFCIAFGRSFVHLNNLASIEHWIVQIQLCVLSGKPFSE